MIALPSIAFGGFSGSAKGVTARQVGGRSILSVRSFPTGMATSAQVVRRASLSKISKSYKTLSDAQMLEWERLAQHTSGQSVFGQKAELSGINLYVRLNANRVMAGEAVIADAPAALTAVPNVEYEGVFVMPSVIAFTGIVHETAPYKLVVKMSGAQSAGVSNGWSKTVILSPGMEDDWGEADVTELYLKSIGVAPAVGQKVFIETYWLDTVTGCTGQVFRDSAICVSDGSSGYTPRRRVTMRNLNPEQEQHVSSLDVDFSTGAPVVQFDSVCLGHSNVASSYAYLDQDLPADCVGTSMALGRGMGDGNCALAAQSYIIWLRNDSWDGANICFAHRGGYYVKPTEVFGPGILY